MQGTALLRSLTKWRNVDDAGIPVESEVKDMEMMFILAGLSMSTSLPGLSRLTTQPDSSLQMCMLFSMPDRGRLLVVSIRPSQE